MINKDELWTYRVERHANGWYVDATRPDGYAFPKTSYENKYDAAARLLQLLGLSISVEPQTWPENVCLGSVQAESDQGE